MKGSIQDRLLWLQGLLSAATVGLVVALFAWQNTQLGQSMNTTLTASLQQAEIEQRRAADELATQQSTLIETAARERAQYLGGMLGRLIGESLRNFDVDSAARLCSEAAKDPDVVLCRVVAPSGDLIAGSYDGPEGTVALRGKEQQGALEDEQRRLRASGALIEITVPAAAEDGHNGGTLVLLAAPALLRKHRTTLTEGVEALHARTHTALESMRGAISGELDKAQGSARTAGVLCGLGAILIGVGLSWLFLRRLVGTIGAACGQLENVTADVAENAQYALQRSASLANGASDQASSLEETSSSLEELASMTRQNATLAETSNHMARKASTSATEADSAMARMSSVMEQIKTSSDQTAKILKTIDAIAFQTNLLALNAAVEAARAGDAGRGFAVVAEEVRNLARRTAESAKSTAGLIAQNLIGAEQGVNASADVRAALGRIGTSIKELTQSCGELAAASAEQVRGLDQISQAVARIDQVTQSNAASAADSAEASQSLSERSRELQGVVNTLVGVIGGTVKQVASGAHAESAEPAHLNAAGSAP